MATYRALCDLFLPSGVLAEAGSFLSDAVPIPDGFLGIPIGWIPPIAVEPQDLDGMQRYFAAGPRGMNDAEPNRSALFNGPRWSNRPAVPPPKIYWKPGLGPNGQPGFLLGSLFHDLT